MFFFFFIYLHKHYLNSICVYLFLVCCSVKITKFNVSSSHLLRNDVDSNDLILDCDYDIDRIEHGFVLKWLFNNSQIYQWIPGQKPSITFVSV